MNILIAFDKFKDALPADAVCENLKAGILQSFPEAHCQTLALADGGEGTLNVLAQNLGGEFITCQVQDPLFRPIQADYLWVESSKTAIIEMARASGYELLKPEERNCSETSTIGTGELIKNAIEKGAKKIILSVGGSATNDAGIGMATALGFTFFDENHNILTPIGKNLAKIHSIEKTSLDLNQITFQVISDVTNPFYGENGAAFVFAPQKGADRNQVLDLDKGLQNIDKLFETTFGKSVQNIPGSGCGGGIGGGAMAFLNAQISSAADWILEVCKISEKLQESDILITGEGRIDSQSWQGKLLSRLTLMAEKHQVPVILVCGTLESMHSLDTDSPIIYATSILNRPMPLEEALRKTKPLLIEKGIMLGNFLSKISLNK